MHAALQNGLCYDSTRNALEPVRPHTVILKVLSKETVKPGVSKDAIQAVWKSFELSA